VVAVIDGTNLAMRCRSGPPDDSRSPEGRLRGWLLYLRAVTGAATTLVAFDNKGSVGGNARAELHPGYNRARYKAPGAPAQRNQQQQQQQQQLSGWSHMDGAVVASGCVPVHAAVGYEADDVMGCVVQWVSCKMKAHPKCVDGLMGRWGGVQRAVAGVD